MAESKNSKQIMLSVHVDGEDLNERVLYLDGDKLHYATMEERVKKIAALMRPGVTMYLVLEERSKFKSPAPTPDAG